MSDGDNVSQWNTLTLPILVSTSGLVLLACLCYCYVSPRVFFPGTPFDQRRQPSMRRKARLKSTLMTSTASSSSSPRTPSTIGVNKGRSRVGKGKRRKSTHRRHKRSPVIRHIRSASRLLVKSWGRMVDSIRSVGGSKDSRQSLGVPSTENANTDRMPRSRLSNRATSQLDASKGHHHKSQLLLSKASIVKTQSQQPAPQPQPAPLQPEMPKDPSTTTTAMVKNGHQSSSLSYSKMSNALGDELDMSDTITPSLEEEIRELERLRKQYGGSTAEGIERIRSLHKLSRVRSRRLERAMSRCIQSTGGSSGLMVSTEQEAGKVDQKQLRQPSKHSQPSTQPQSSPSPHTPPPEPPPQPPPPSTQPPPPSTQPPSTPPPSSPSSLLYHQH